MSFCAVWWCALLTGNGEGKPIILEERNKHHSRTWRFGLLCVCLRRVCWVCVQFKYVGPASRHHQHKVRITSNQINIASGICTTASRLVDDGKYSEAVAVLGYEITSWKWWWVCCIFNIASFIIIFLWYKIVKHSSAEDSDKPKNNKTKR